MLSGARIFERDTIYLIGIPELWVKQELLGLPDFMGQYGRIESIRYGRSFILKQRNEVRHQAYIKYSHQFEASIAIAALDEVTVGDQIFQSSYATNKYCKSYIRGQVCSPACHYIHSPPPREDFIDVSMFGQNNDKISEEIFKQAKVEAFCFIRRHLQCCAPYLEQVAPYPQKSKLPPMRLILQYAT